MRNRRFVLILLILSIFSCSEKKKKQSLFDLKSETDTGIRFSNTLSYTEDFNPYVYRNFYNGGGVAIGDINNDGLEDIYFTGNQVDNKLYLNKGNWQFEDITQNAGVLCSGVWSTGATFADINGDGLLDLYVCKSGKPGGLNRHNELFINNGNLTFTEASKEYGLDVEGLSVQAAFFDYDKDGDLDCYVLNNSIKSIGAFDLVKDQRTIPDDSGNGNKFFRNDNQKFIDITEQAQIYSSKIGFGLGITLGDFNNDDWTDIFVSNDFFERDYLYINDTKGQFSEALESYFTSISMGSMGADLADLNNDLLPDLMVTEMLPETETRKKTKTIFESWDKQQLAEKQGYFKQYSRNTLQRNLGAQGFLELGRQSNVAATEWSWSTLLFDMDNDGQRDIYVSNGIYKDLLDRDYLTYESNEEVIKNKVKSNEKDIIKNLIDAMPSQPMVNAVFRNLGDFKFEKSEVSWGLDQPSFSNGSAYGDLDNDGDLDLVVNNVNMPAFLYENNTDTLAQRSVKFKFRMKDLNTRAIGTKVYIYHAGNSVNFGENFTSRGFQSSVPDGVHFGVGNSKTIDSVIISWPNGALSKLQNVSTNQLHIINYPDQPVFARIGKEQARPILKETGTLFDFDHKENSFIDFNNERLLPQMFSNEGPALATTDLNGDAIPDFFLGGAKNQSASLFISSPNGYVKNDDPFLDAITSEDTDALFFDGDNDGDMDLYVCHGGKAFSPYAVSLNDQYYINEGNSFKRATTAPKFPSPISSSTVSAADFDKDGDVDLFIGERYKTRTYGLPGSGYLLVNDGKGNFGMHEEKAFKDMGMITDAEWHDINNDGWEDLVVVGEWMPIKVFINDKGVFTDESNIYGLSDTSGIWSTLHLSDIDGDSDQDLIVGNTGLNNFLEPGMRMFVGDFDGNGFKEQLICKRLNGYYYPIVDKDELISQIPSLKKKLLYYKDYGNATMATLFSKKILEKAVQSDLQLLESTVFYNKGKHFEPIPLPSEIQYAPVYAITSEDVDNDGSPDLFFGGNQYLVKPQFGRYDASKGWAIFGPHSQKDKFKNAIPLNITGQIRDLKWISSENKKRLIVPTNNDKVKFYEY